MGKFDNYKCEGQMNISDWLNQCENALRQNDVTETVSIEEENKKSVSGDYVIDYSKTSVREDIESSYRDDMDYWHDVPGVLPNCSEWRDALLVIRNPVTKECHYNMPGEVKDKTFRQSPNSSEGEVIAWKYAKP